MSRQASGLKAWAIQRVTAIYIGLFALYLLLAMMFAMPESYAAWKDWFSGAGMSTFTMLFVLSVLMHAWIGVRDVLIDYLHNIAIRTTALSVVAFVLIASGVLAAQALVLSRIV